MLQPGALVWIRYSGTVSCGELVHCMPELNMYTVRPDSERSTRLVTRGIEDILPVCGEGLPNIPPDDEEWENNFVACESKEVTFDEHRHLLSCYGDNVVSLASISSPLFIDATERSSSRVSADEIPSGGPPPSYSGLLSNSPVSFTLSPPVTNPSAPFQLDDCLQPSKVTLSESSVLFHPASYSIPKTTDDSTVVLENNTNFTLDSEKQLPIRQSNWTQSQDADQLSATCRIYPSDVVTANWDIGGNSQTTTETRYCSINSVPLEVPSETDSGPQNDLGNTANTGSVHVISEAMRLLLRWVESLIANRQSSTTMEPIHQVPLSTLNEAIELLLSLSSVRYQMDSCSHLENDYIQINRTTSTGDGTDVQNTAFASSVSEFDINVQKSPTESAKLSRHLSVSVPEEDANQPSSFQGKNQWLWWKKRQQNSSITNDAHLGLCYWQSSSKVLPENNPTSPPTPVEQYSAIADSCGFSRRIGTDQLDVIRESVTNTPDLRSQDLCYASHQTATPTKSDTPHVTFPFPRSFGRHDPFFAVSSSHTGNPEPGAYSGLLVSTTHSSITADNLTVEAHGNDGTPIGGLSVDLILHYINQLCQNQSGPLCASVMELLQKISAVITLLLKPHAPVGHPSTTESSSVEPCDRLPITHLTPIEGQPVSAAPKTAGSHSCDVRRRWTDAIDLVRTSTEFASCGANTNAAVYTQTTSNALSASFFSSRSVVDQPIDMLIKQVDERRRNILVKQTVPKRNRTISASAFVPLSSAGSPSSWLHRGVSSGPKTHSDVGSSGAARTLGSASNELDLVNPCSSVDANAAGTSNTSSTSCSSTTPKTTPLSRSDVKKCRKMYGIEHRDQWCNQCRWKKACRRFPDQNNNKAAILGTQKRIDPPTDSKLCCNTSPSMRRADQSDVAATALMLPSYGPVDPRLYPSANASYSRSAPAAFPTSADIRVAEFLNKQDSPLDNATEDHSAYM